MPILNEVQATYKDQVEIDAGDIAMWELVDQGYSVLSGGAVTEQGTPDGTVAVAAGVAKVGGAAVSFAGGNVSVLTGAANADGSIAQGSDGTQARFSLIVVNASGQLGAVHGNTAPLSSVGDGSYTDVFPTFAGKTVLAAIRIPPTFTTVAASMLSDKRLFRTDGDFVARVITPAAISATQHNYAPAGLKTANVVRQATSSSSQQTITGLDSSGFLDGRLLAWHNTGTGNQGFGAEHGSSTAANRFAIAGDIVLLPGGSMILQYDVASSRWRIFPRATAATNPAVTFGTTNVGGTSSYFVRSDDQLALFDATVPVTQAFSDAAATGSAAVAARRDHKHGMPAGATLATDTLWSQKGDQPVATGNDAAVMVPIGTDFIDQWIPDASQTSGIRWGHRRDPLRPSGAIAETYQRGNATTSNAQGAGASGTLLMDVIPLASGITITSITYVSGATALVTGTHQIFGLYDSALALLRGTTDDTNTAWAANTPKTLTLTSPFVTTYSGLHYVGVLVTASTMPTFSGTIATGTAVVGLTPVLQGVSSTSQTSLPNPAAALTVGAGHRYAYVS